MHTHTCAHTQTHYKAYIKRLSEARPALWAILDPDWTDRRSPQNPASFLLKHFLHTGWSKLVCQYVIIFNNYERVSTRHDRLGLVFPILYLCFFLPPKAFPAICMYAIALMFPILLLCTIIPKKPEMLTFGQLSCYICNSQRLVRPWCWCEFDLSRAWGRGSHLQGVWYWL